MNINKNDILENESFGMNKEKSSSIIQYKNNIGKLLPLSYVVTEIENYLENSYPGDSLVLLSRNSSPSIEEKCDNGIVIATARSNDGREFVVFYKAKYNQFGLFVQKQTGKDTFEYNLISSWNITIEDGNWFDPSDQVLPGENSIFIER